MTFHPSGVDFVGRNFWEEMVKVVVVEEEEEAWWPRSTACCTQ